MKARNYAFSLGIGLNMFFAEYYGNLPVETQRNWSFRVKHAIGLKQFSKNLT